jgi:hypothetical protein
MDPGMNLPGISVSFYGSRPSVYGSRVSLRALDEPPYSDNPEMTIIAIVQSLFHKKKQLSFGAFFAKNVAK